MDEHKKTGDVVRYADNITFKLVLSRPLHISWAVPSQKAKKEIFEVDDQPSVTRKAQNVVERQQNLERRVYPSIAIIDGVMETI